MVRVVAARCEAALMLRKCFALFKCCEGDERWEEGIVEESDDVGGGEIESELKAFRPRSFLAGR